MTPVITRSCALCLRPFPSYSPDAPVHCASCAQHRKDFVANAVITALVLADIVLLVSAFLFTLLHRGPH